MACMESWSDFEMGKEKQTEKENEPAGGSGLQEGSEPAGGSDNDRKSTTYILASIGVIVLVLAGLFAWQYFKKTDEKPSFPSVKYNNFVFYHVADGTLWQWDWQSGSNVYNLMLHYNPYEVENIPVSGSLDESFNTPQVYITFDPAEGNNFGYIAAAAGELSLSVNSALGAEVVAACSQNVTEACASRPIITCYNSNIFHKEDRETKLEMKGNCVVVQGQGKGIIRAADRLLYLWYGVMK